eukprot:superscaffoldBa00000015_g287
MLDWRSRAACQFCARMPTKELQQQADTFMVLHCGAQEAAATNNIVLLSSTVSAMATKPGALPAELETDVGEAMMAVLILTTDSMLQPNRLHVFLPPRTSNRRAPGPTRPPSHLTNISSNGSDRDAGILILILLNTMAYFRATHLL